MSKEQLMRKSWLWQWTMTGVILLCWCDTSTKGWQFKPFARIFYSFLSSHQGWWWKEGVFFLPSSEVVKGDPWFYRPIHFWFSVFETPWVLRTFFQCLFLCQNWICPWEIDLRSTQVDQIMFLKWNSLLSSWPSSLKKRNRSRYLVRWQACLAPIDFHSSEVFFLSCIPDYFSPWIQTEIPCLQFRPFDYRV